MGNAEFDRHAILDLGSQCAKRFQIATKRKHEHHLEYIDPSADEISEETMVAATRSIHQRVHVNAPEFLFMADRFFISPSASLGFCEAKQFEQEEIE